MKKLLYLTCTLIMISAAVLAQSDVQRKQDIESFRIAYFTQQIGLTAEEAKHFWPVYNEMRKELDLVRKDRKQRNKMAREKSASMSDKDFVKLLDDEFLSRQKELEIERNYLEKYKAVLPIEKVVRLYKAEEGFKRELLKRIQEKPEHPEIKKQH